MEHNHIMIWLCPIYIRSILIDVLILPFWVQFSGLMRPSLVNTNAGHMLEGTIIQVRGTIIQVCTLK